MALPLAPVRKHVARSSRFDELVEAAAKEPLIASAIQAIKERNYPELAAVMERIDSLNAHQRTALEKESDFESLKLWIGKCRFVGLSDRWKTLGLDQFQELHSIAGNQVVVHFSRWTRHALRKLDPELEQMFRKVEDDARAALLQGL